MPSDYWQRNGRPSIHRPRICFALQACLRLRRSIVPGCVVTGELRRTRLEADAVTCGAHQSEYRMSTLGAA